LLFRFRQTFNEGFGGSSAVHAAALVGPALILAGEEVVENGLHFLDRFEPSASAFNTEVFIEQRAMQTLDNAVGLRTLDPRRAVLDFLELQEQFVGMLIGPPAELADSPATTCESPLSAGARSLG
jgi:hypothetical protein